MTVGQEEEGPPWDSVPALIQQPTPFHLKGMSASETERAAFIEPCVCGKVRPDSFALLIPSLRHSLILLGS